MREGCEGRRSRCEAKRSTGARTACLTKSPLPSNPEAARPERVKYSSLRGLKPEAIS
jgi:hypothetical protein